MISFILLCLCVSEIFIQENICVCIITLFVTSRTLSFCLCFCAYVFQRWVSLILFVFFRNRVWSNLSINDFARGGFRKLCFNFDTYAKRIRCFTIQIGPIFALCKYCQVLHVDCHSKFTPSWVYFTVCFKIILRFDLLLVNS